MSFIPPGAKASSLTVSSGVAYTTTIAGCGGVPAGVWAIDLNGESPKVANFPVKTGDLRGIAPGTGGTIFAHANTGVVALSPQTSRCPDSSQPQRGAANT